MPRKHIAWFLALFYSVGSVSPLVAQQTPAPLQPTPVPAQPSPTPSQQPGSPSERPPVPRRLPIAPRPGIPGPTQSTPQPQAAPVPTPQPGPAADAPAPTAPGGTVATPPERRLLPPPAIPGAGAMVSLNFNRADLVEIIHILAQHLKLTYTIDPEVKGTVTIHSAEPLRTEDLLPIFHQVLRMNGAVAVRTGNIYRITPIKDGKGLARPVGQSREDSFAIQIVPVRFFSVAEMKKLLTPFLMPGGELIEYPRGNFLMIIDLPSNIQRLVEIADLIDVQVFAGTRMEIYQPKVASAEELATEMTKIMQSFAGSAPQTDNFAAQFIPIPRINQLLVISHSEAAWTYARRWLERIDIIAEGPGRRIFIYPVENGKAIELADVLSQALGLAVTGRREAPRTLQDLHRSTQQGGTSPFGARSSMGTAIPGSTTTQQSQPFGLYATVPVPGQPTAPAAPPVAPAPGVPGVAPRPPTPAAAGAKPEEQLRIVPDPATNSLIIYGTAQEFQNIKNILKDLDAIPRQVLLDAVVLQIDLKDSENFGVDYEILRNPGNVNIFNQTFNSRGAVITGALVDALTKLGSTGLGRAGLVGVIGTGNNVRAFVNALMTDSRVKLLSSPSVLATDNRPARIQVGAEEPIPTGTITAAVGQPTVSSSTTIQYRNTGRILTIIPQINSLGLVNLQIKAEISARGDNVTVGQDSFPSFNTQDAETTAVVQDGETLVIGGLIGERKSKTRSGIPYLMDLPVVGRFFGTTNDETTRTELVMLITPRVIRNKEESRQVTDDFRNSLSRVRSELERMRREEEQEEQRREQIRQEQQRRLEEQQKLQRQMQEQEKPAAPPPSTEQPTTAPSRTPPTQGLQPAPMQKISVPAESKQLAPNRSNTPELTLSRHTLETSRGILESERFAGTDRDKEPAPPVEKTSPNTTIEQTDDVKVAQVFNAAQGTTKPRQVWVVQVASFALEKDAEFLAKKLREKGYDAHVVAADVSGKAWHRVRVGQLASRAEAFELQKNLESNEKLVQTVIFAGK